MSDNLHLVMAGHVDHGKSTLIGRLLADTDSLEEGAYEQVQDICDKRGIDFEYAYLLDALMEEQEQGLTIDVTKIEFDADRHYTIIDAPGHKEFLKNMLSGASHAEAAVLIVDAEAGVEEQTNRHAYLLNLLGIEQVMVVVNKMDLVDYDQQRYETVKEDVHAYLDELGIDARQYIPLSAKKGDNVTETSTELSWYDGDTFLNALQTFRPGRPSAEKSLRMPIQDVYKFDDRRIVAGRVEAGTVSEGQDVEIWPKEETTTVDSIEAWKDSPDEVTAGYPAGVTLTDEFYLERGNVICDSKPSVSNLFTANLFWMGEEPLRQGNEYRVKLHTQDVECTIHSIDSVIDAESLEEEDYTDKLVKNDVGTIVVKTDEPVVFDPFIDVDTTGRFVLVNDGVVRGGGIIQEQAEELRERESVQAESKLVTPKTSLVNLNDREARQEHTGKVVWLTGLAGSGKKRIAKNVEKELFDRGVNAYYLDAGNVRLSLSSDLDFSKESRHEHARRVAEVANILYHSGFVVIVSIISPYREDREYARQIIGEENFIEMYMNTPLSLCKERDPHGIYSKAERGEITGVPGVDVDYEESTAAVEIDAGGDFDAFQVVKELADRIEDDVR